MKTNIFHLPIFLNIVGLKKDKFTLIFYVLLPYYLLRIKNILLNRGYIIMSYKIVEKKKLNDVVYLMDIEAPRVAHSAKPGQFIIVIIDEKGERMPLTIADYDKERGTVTIVFQVVGFSSKKLGKLEVGDSIKDFVGPLGQPSEFIYEDIDELKKKKIIFIAGGVGAAPV